MFFKDYAAFIVRPRDDKHETIRRMIEEDLAEQERERGRALLLGVTDGHALQHSRSRFSLCSINLLSTFHNASGGGDAPLADSVAGAPAEHCAEPRQPTWLRELPNSLRVLSLNNKPHRLSTNAHVS